MKRLLVIAALAVSPLACVGHQGDASIRFLHALALTEESDRCVPVEDAYTTGGSLDVSAGSNYLLGVAVETNTYQQDIIVGGEIFADEGLSDITLTEVVYSYESSDPSLSLPAPEEDRVPIYAVFRPQTDPDESYIFFDGFGPKAFGSLMPHFVSGVDASGDPILTGANPVTVLTTIKARGYLSGGQNVESNIITFPITVFAYGTPTCTGEQVPSGTCGHTGQGGPITCVTPSS